MQNVDEPCRDLGSWFVVIATRARCVLWLGAVAACGSSEQLATTSSEIVIVSPPVVDFGLVPVGHGSGLQVITLNPGPDDSFDSVNNITANCGDFSLNLYQGLPGSIIRQCDNGGGGGELIPGLFCPTLFFQNYEFGATFHPSVAGPQSCVVNIDTTDGLKTATLMGVGDPPPLEIDVTPLAAAFGEVRINTDSSAAPIVVGNLGGTPLTVINVSVSGPYAFSGPASFVLNGSEATAINVVCHPSAVGAQPGMLTIQSNDPDEMIVNVALSCSGVASALDLSPSPLVIAPTRVGDPQQRLITLTNLGGASTTLLDVSLVGSGIELVSAPPGNTVLPAGGGSAIAAVRFPAATEGDASATMVVVTSDGTRNVAISATAQVATLALDPDGAVNFGPVCIGKTAERTFTALGTAAGFANIQTISDPGTPFAMMLPALPARVEGRGLNRVTFTAQAAPTSTGVATKPLTVTTDIPNDTPRMLSLSVEGLPAGVTATPAEVQFGTFEVNATSTAQAISLTNCTNDAIEFTNPRIEGSDGGEFAIVVSPTGSAIAASEAANWLVVASPRSLGIKSAEFVVDASGSSYRIPLTSEGFDINGDGGGVGSDSSYYGWGCSTSGGTTGLSLVVVFGWIIRRRRGTRS